MNSALQTTHSDLTGALAGITGALTLGDACDRMERGFHTLTSLAVLMRCKPEDDLASVLRRLETYIRRQRMAAEQRHDLLDPNYYASLIEHHSKLTAVACRSSNNLHHLKAIIEHWKADKAAKLLPTDGLLDEAMRLIDEELGVAA